MAKVAGRYGKSADDSRHLRYLDKKVAARVAYILQRMRQLGYDAVIQDSIRTREQQRENVRRGVSWTMRSKHLPNKDGVVRAVDIVSASKGWGASEDFWFTLGRLALLKGLGWGGLWGLPRAERAALEAFLTDMGISPWVPQQWRVTVQGRRGIRNPKTGRVHFRGRDPAHVEVK